MNYLLIIFKPVYREIAGFNKEKDGRINLIDGSTVSIDLPSAETPPGAGPQATTVAIKSLILCFSIYMLYASSV